VIKHYSQLFGEEDPDQDVSPDTADPEAAGNTIIIIIDITYYNSIIISIIIS